MALTTRLSLSETCNPTADRKPQWARNPYHHSYLLMWLHARGSYTVLWTTYSYRIARILRSLIG